MGPRERLLKIGEGLISFLSLSILLLIGIAFVSPSPLLPYVSYGVWGVSWFGFWASTILAAYFSLRCLLLGIESQRWPSVLGKIVRSKVQEWRFGSLSGGGGGRTVFTVDILYDYRVSGKCYQGRRVAFRFWEERESFYIKKTARQAAERFPIDKEIRVFHHPKNPKIAVIEPGLFGRNYWQMGWVLALVILSFRGSLYLMSHLP